MDVFVVTFGACRRVNHRPDSWAMGTRSPWQGFKRSFAATRCKYVLLLYRSWRPPWERIVVEAGVLIPITISPQLSGCQPVDSHFLTLI